MTIAARWIAISVFVISNALNYLDRQVLAALAPTIKVEFGLDNRDFGFLLAVFSVVYALAAPAAGLFIDRVGLNRGATLSVGLWSAAGVATGLVSSFAGLVGCRALLGLTEAGAVPGAGKAVASYLPPQERALGTAAGQLGISTGLIAAPVVAGLLAESYGWRSAFMVTGALGFLWIPLWLFTVRRVPAVTTRRPEHAQIRVSGMLADRAFWGLVVATMLVMTVYSLWTNWTTVFLTHAWGMSQEEANLRLAWMPPLAGGIGGLLGGALSLGWARRLGVQSARLRTCTIGALVVLTTAAIPWMPSAGLAIAAASLSLMCAALMSVNVYAMPMDVFGPDRAAFSISALTFAFGAMQAALSPLIGWVVDHHGFAPICLVAAVLPLGAIAVLRLTLPRS